MILINNIAIVFFFKCKCVQTYQRYKAHKLGHMRHQLFYKLLKLALLQNIHYIKTYIIQVQVNLCSSEYVCRRTAVKNKKDLTVTYWSMTELCRKGGVAHSFQRFSNYDMLGPLAALRMSTEKMPLRNFVLWMSSTQEYIFLYIVWAPLKHKHVMSIWDIVG